MSHYSRRTLVRGVAWSVPVVAVAANAPAFATSHDVPPPPVINFGGACGNTGAKQKGCGGDKTIQVPLTLSNPTSEDVVFQITSMYTCNCETAPTAAGAGVVSGVRGIFRTPSHAVANQNKCAPVAEATCSGGVDGGTILVPAGTAAATYWIESNSLGDASRFSSRISYRLLSASGSGSSCAVLSTGEAFTAAAISPGNCNGS